MKKENVNEIIKRLYTVQDIIRWVFSCLSSSNVFYGHGIENAWEESLQLVLSNINLPYEYTQDMRNAKITKNECSNILNGIEKRIRKRIPMPYITSKSLFYGYEFYVNQKVLIPRSYLVEVINSRFRKYLRNKPSYILDLGTGSGCLAIICSYKFPKAVVEASDVSSEVLNVAKYNVVKHRKNNIKLIKSDLFENLSFKRYNVIITNPPYVKRSEFKYLPYEYHYEPPLGLLADENGLEFINKIIINAYKYLTENGILVCEVGSNKEKLEEFFPELPFKWFKFKDNCCNAFILTRRELMIPDMFF
ncbi:50S ribosomal protein L3 glutamine methyltransferase [Candidatus Annandia adelgestsuga]|uniref:50S ribosomal protein L3 glutamine methyltransferase n=1 Tax=Candidatus Annandia adelgestsuga TaxID=1302411 RepID=A0A3S9J7R8_9ENTR|nr:50S ribosomal protein L3 N(5)-glutamine methyltransferase [Candidatus Annandia adelgestsuga]AZP36314.1 50S ribosomal protein L3 glutamine methyltransferase [Candidatus Annandia adelgestsuga]